ncbi:radical SAM protein [bacterium]|nr:radical SAM protein [bacterium]
MERRAGTSAAPFLSLNTFLRERFGGKTRRIPLSLHRPCPNRTGGKTGCIFCLPEAYEPAAAFSRGSVTEQIERHVARAKDCTKFIAYFQSGSNTAGPVDELEAAFSEALAFDEIVALSIATRPDCLSPESLGLIKRLQAGKETWVELGVQTAHDRTLALLDRGHDAACSLDAIARLRAACVPHIVLHLIAGLPGESEAEMIETVSAFSVSAGSRPRPAGLPRRSVGSGPAEPGNNRSRFAASAPGAPQSHPLGFKIHHLQVVKGTPLEALWREGRVPTYALDDYARLLVTLLEHTPEDVVIHRVIGDVPDRHLVAPRWDAGKAAALQRILAEFKNRKTRQGRLAKEDV